MPIGVYLDLIGLLSQTEPDNVKIVSLLSGYSVDELMDMPVKEYRRVSDASTMWLASPFRLRKGKPQPVTLKGVTLVPVTDIDKMTTAQYIDWQNYAGRHGEGVDYTIEMLSCFFVPEGKTYGKGYDMAEVHSLIRNHMSVTEARSLADFFLVKFQSSIMNTARSLEILTRLLQRVGRKEQALALQREEMEYLDLYATGVGLRMWMTSPRLSALVGMKSSPDPSESSSRY